jgi:hypothetical protein
MWCFTSIYKSVNGDRRQRALTSKAFLHVAPEMVRAPLHPTSSTQPYFFSSSCFAWAMAKKSGRWCCYILHFVTDRGVERTYYGTTELCRGQTATEACEVRMETHQTRPLKWMRKAIRKSMSIVPLVTLSEKNALAQEALYTLHGLARPTGCCYEGVLAGTQMSKKLVQKPAPENSPESGIIFWDQCAVTALLRCRSFSD